MGWLSMMMIIFIIIIKFTSVIIAMIISDTAVNIRIFAKQAKVKVIVASSVPMQHWQQQ